MSSCEPHLLLLAAIFLSIFQKLELRKRFKQLSEDGAGPSDMKRKLDRLMKKLKVTVKIQIMLYHSSGSGGGVAVIFSPARYCS